MHGLKTKKRPIVCKPKRNGKSSDGYVEKSSGLPNLPEACIVAILSCLPPREVAKAACVCRSYHLASQFDSVWASMLPPGHMEMLELITDPKPLFKSKKDIVIYLATPKFFAKGTKAYQIDTAMGGVMLSISARGLCIVHDNIHQTWMRSKNSLFPEVTQLKDAYRFGAWVDFEVALPPGSYTLFWRIQFKRPSNFGDEDVRCTFSTSSHNVLGGMRFINGRYSVLPLLESAFNRPAIRVLQNRWHEYEVAEFSVDTKEPTCMLWVAMRTNRLGLWRSWTSMDMIVIRPTNTTKDLYQGQSSMAGPIVGRERRLVRRRRIGV